MIRSKGWTKNDEIAKLVTNHILEIILEQNSIVREEVCWNLLHNNIICLNCGTGDRENPNSRCCCQRDD